MAGKNKIDIVSDIVCPWCIVAYKRLEKAIEDLGLQEQIEIEWHAFELNPMMPAEGQNLQEHLSQKYGTTLAQGKQSREQLKQLGAEVDFKFDFFDEMRMPNTKNAHILLDYALPFGKQTEFNLRLVTAHFSEQKDLSDPQILAQELKALGLNAEEGLERINNTEARKLIDTKEAHWKEMGIRAVPTIIFNQKTALTGAQSIDVYKKLLAEP